ncbi:MAG: helicase associated domain-containing protein [Yaniella sp.]|uniref:helicase associated domain-containing protein n=1 Tax=Yaniella sp. TaxID=2773929 RepID=UPI002648C9FD|nr:helicase associated domain-containing protein [Yaniella sp.]MDN6147768.1 helicase associated domain-containing protein [Yaniella sp.]MDN6458170.1 helicase associated domain-containing protein [Bifidobacterium crudilactis]MDN6757757.1 helicase associated domain-containing protein [Yaniella sp.]
MGRGRVDFDRGIARLSAYAKEHGHANPKADEEWLAWRVGLWISSLRVKYRSGKLTVEQVAAAEAIGVRFVPPYRDHKPKPPTRAEHRESELLRRFEWLENYFREHGHINAPQIYGTSTWPSAGRWIARLRSQYREKKLPQSVVAKAERMNIVWNPGPGRRSY